MFADDPTRPSHCLFCMTLPLSKEEFFRRLDPAYPDNYVQTRKRQLDIHDNHTLWEKDYLPSLRLFEHEMNLLRTLGVHIIEQFSLKDLATISGYRATAIMAHHEEEADRIELYDGRYSFEEFLNAMPPGFDRIIDLTICESITLQTAITKKFRNCLAVANVMETTPEFRLICYRKAISFLRDNDMDYIEAIKKVRLLLIQNDKKK